jgi:hypothetical protein
MQKAGLKVRIRGVLLWAGLVTILLLLSFSIYGAFLGAERAQRFFNSIPLSVYWIIFAGLLTAGIGFFPRLLHIRGLFLVHLGGLLVLAGGIWGSQAGMKLQDRVLGIDTIRAGQMKIFEGQTQKTVTTENMLQKDLPFEIRLVDFKIEYYEPGTLLIQTTGGAVLRVKAEPGTIYDVGSDYGSVEILRRFENFKLNMEQGKHIIIDDPNDKPNPALEVLLKKPDGSEIARYAFQKFAGHLNVNDKMAFSYRRGIRDFISDLEVIKDGKVVMQKSIEVNKPLHFGGYIFYQQGYDDDAHKFTVLRVTSDKGLFTVYLGFVLLCAGVFWHLWLRHLFGDRSIED